MKEMFYQWIGQMYFRLRTNNNWRLAALWMMLFLLLLFNLTIFGFGPSIEFDRSEEAQRYYNAYFHGEFKTDMELAPWYSRIFEVIEESLGWIWDGLRWLSWLVWFILLIAGVIYTPIAFQDELRRAYRQASRKLRERRGSPAKGTPPTEGKTPTPSTETALGGLTGMMVLIREIIGATIGNIITRHR